MGSVFSFLVSEFFQILLELVIHYLSILGQTIHALADFEVDMVVMCEG